MDAVTIAAKSNQHNSSMVYYNRIYQIVFSCCGVTAVTDPRAISFARIMEPHNKATQICGIRVW